MSFEKKNNPDIIFDKQRQQMVNEQLIKRDIKNQDVLTAMQTVPRHLFVNEALHSEAYDDGPLPIGSEQTISQPYIVASMTEMLCLSPKSRVLEIGTGCGYQAAVLAELALDVYTIEIIPDLFKETLLRFEKLHYENIHMKFGDGSLGWPELAPYDGIIITAAAPRIPEKLIEQLAQNGVMVLPLGEGRLGLQELIKVEKRNGRLEQTSLYSVRFVPMTGEVNT